MNNKKTVSLVLGSGGAKGMAHIGVIRCLQDHGFDIRYVAGSSIGAIVGGVYAAGYLDAFVEWTTALRKRDVLRLLDFSFRSGAIFKGDRIMDALQDLIGECRIEDLPIGYTAVATDISLGSNGSEIWFNEGSLYDAMRASMAVPSVFSPLIHNGMILVDGGVINPVPVAPTLNDQTDLTIAVNLNGTHDENLRLEDEQTAAEKTKDTAANSSDNPIAVAYQNSIGQFIDRFWPEDAQMPITDSLNVENLGLLEVMVRSMETMEAALTQFKLAATAPTHLIEIPCNLCSFLDFHHSDALIAYGYDATLKKLALASCE